MQLSFVAFATMIVVAIYLKECTSVDITVRRLERCEIGAFANFRAAVFSSGQRCEVARLDAIRDLIERRMEEGSRMLVAACSAEDLGRMDSGGENGADSSDQARTLQSMIGELSSRLRPTLEVSAMLDQQLEDGKKLVGVMEASMSELELPTHSLGTREGIYCTALAVHPQHRRAGIATKLIDTAEAEARLVAASALMLHVDRDNLEAIRFYETCGFSKAKNEPRYRQFAVALALNPDAHVFFTRPVSEAKLYDGESQVMLGEVAAERT